MNPRYDDPAGPLRDLDSDSDTWRLEFDDRFEFDDRLHDARYGAEVSDQ